MAVVIVGFDFKFIEKFAEQISCELNFGFVNLKKEFDKILLSYNGPITIENEVLQIQETKLIEEYSKQNNTVVALSDDMLFSNSNYKKIENNLIIFINNENLNNFQKKLKNLLKNKKIIEINQEKFNLNEIINNIRGYYDR